MTTGEAATRPHYGGTLRVEVGATIASLDPLDKTSDEAEAEAKQRLAAMVFDRLVRLDDDGRPQPQLALSWSQDAESKRWQFMLRSGVKLPDGSALSPQSVATSLTAAKPDWRISVLGEALIIESDSPAPGLLAELAEARQSIVVRGADGKLQGAGPYRVSEWQPRRGAVLVANQEYWGGRPYLDTVEIGMRRPLREQLIDLQLGKADVIEVGLDQARRLTQEGQRVVLSPAVETMVVEFLHGRPPAEDARLREALALSIDRGAIHTILLQKQGELAVSLLPQWLSGYAFLFSTPADPARAGQLSVQLSNPPALALSYDSGDTLARMVAERIAVKARDVGISLNVMGQDAAAAGSAAARLVRLKLGSTDPRAALARLAGTLHESAEERRAESALPEELYRIERSILEGFWVVPLFHLPEAFGLSPRVRGWISPRAGGWPLDNIWLEAEKP